MFLLPLLLFHFHPLLVCLLAGDGSVVTRGGGGGGGGVWGGPWPTPAQRYAQVIAALRAAALFALRPAAIMPDIHFLY